MKFRILIMYGEDRWLYRNNVLISNKWNMGAINARSELLWTVKFMKHRYTASYGIGGGHDI